MKATLKISTSYFEILYFEIGSGPKSQTDFWIHQHTSCLYSTTQANINASIECLVSTPTPLSWVKVMDVNLHSPHLGGFWLWKARRVVSGSGGLKLTWTPHWILVCLCLRPKDLEFTSRVRMRHGGGTSRTDGLRVRDWPDNIYSFLQERTLVSTLLLNVGQIKGGLLLHFSLSELKQTSFPEDSLLHLSGSWATLHVSTGFIQSAHRGASATLRPRSVVWRSWLTPPFPAQWCTVVEVLGNRCWAVLRERETVLKLCNRLSTSSPPKKGDSSIFGY